MVLQDCTTQTGDIRGEILKGVEKKFNVIQGKI